jgi:DNA-binding SARP family transcriptional activator
MSKPQVAEGSRFRLQLLGGAALWGDGQLLTGREAQRHRLALLALLACAGESGCSRDRLIALLWPEMDAGHGRHLLANSVYLLRQALGEDAVTASGDCMRLNPARVQRDAAEFQTAVASQDYARAVELYTGPFLDGYFVSGAVEFERWVESKRDRLVRQYATALEALATIRERAGDYTGATAWWEKLAALDPLSSRAAVRLMNALARAGERAAAVRCGREHLSRLRRELDVTEAPEVTALIDRLQHADTVPAAEAWQTGRTPTWVTAPFARAVVRPVSRPTETSALVRATVPSASGQTVSSAPRSLPFAGRESELQTLDVILQRTIAGEGGMAFVTGEAGSGKTALALEFCRRAAEEHADLVVASGNGNAFAGIGDPCLLFREVLAQLAGDVEARHAAGSMSVERCTRLWNTLPLTVAAMSEVGPGLIDTFVGSNGLSARVASYAAQVPEWLDCARYLEERAERPSPPTSQPALFDEYVRVLERVARDRPLLLLLDDLQWADDGSVALLFHLARELRGSRILLMGLFRPSDLALGRNGGRHPLEPVVHELQSALGVVCVPVGEDDDRAFVDALVDAQPNTLGTDFRDALFALTKGHALFVVELLRSLRDQGTLAVDANGRWCLAGVVEWGRLPARVDAAIAGRLAGVQGPLRRALAVASVEGEWFTVEAVAAAAGLSAGDLLSSLAEELEQRHHLVRAYGVRRVDERRVTTYRFRHILFQRFLHDALDDAERAQFHEQLGVALEALHGRHADEIALILARHFEAAQVTDKATHYLLVAGRRAADAMALSDAAALLERAHRLLPALPPGTARDRRELEILMELGTVRNLAASPDLEAPFARACALAERLRDDRLLGASLIGLYYARAHYPGNHRVGRALAGASLAAGRRAGDPTLLLNAHEVVGRNALLRGDFIEALTSYREVERTYQPSHQLRMVSFAADLGPLSQGMLGLTLWPLGYPDQARERSARAVTLAGDLQHLSTLLLVRWYHALVLLMRREPHACVEECVDVLRRSADHGLSAYYGHLAAVPLGWAQAHIGEVERGIATAREGVEQWAVSGWGVWLTWATALFAEALRLGGHPAEGLARLDDAIASGKAVDDLCHEADIRRIRGDLLLALPRPDPDAAEAAYRSSIEIARAQSARSYELRTATHLTRLFRSQGRTSEEPEMLEAVYRWFAEGFETADLVEAKAVLTQRQHPTGDVAGSSGA